MSTKGYLRHIEQFVARGGDINAVVSYGTTRLYRAVEDNKIWMVEILLLFGADPDIPNSVTETPLYRACRDNRLGMVKLLLDYGANQYILTYGETPLQIAIRYNNVGLTNVLREHFSSLNILSKNVIRSNKVDISILPNIIKSYREQDN